MALFSSQPPGTQIKRWLSILTFLVVILDVIAAASLMTVTGIVNSTIVKYEPLLVYSGDIASAIYRVNTGLYQYLAEYRQDTVEIEGEIQNLRKTIDTMSALPAAAELSADLKEIDLTLEKYGKVVRMLPKIGTFTNWSELEELKNEAIGLGNQVEGLATKTKVRSYEEIRRNADRSRNIAAVSMYVFIGFFGLSVIIIGMLFMWWRSFQDMVLRL